VKRFVRLAVLALVIGAGIWVAAKDPQLIDTARSRARAFAASAPEIVVFVVPLVALAVGLFLGRYRTHLFQNRSEAKVSRALKKRFLAPDYHLLSHVTLPRGEGTTQIDHILVSRFGVFVIETKDYRGWIFAGLNHRYWTQVLYRAKFRFRNPLRQNHTHARAVHELLEFLPADAICPVVVFAGTAEFKTAVPDGVFSLAGFLAYVESQAVEVMSINRVQFCVGRLETARLSITKVTDVEHVQRLRRRYGNDD
jgi:hypothetical protein